MAVEAPIEYSSIPGVDCVINPYRIVELASPVAGVIDAVLVERSQKVSAGQVVAQLQADVERSNVELARYRANIMSEINFEQVNVDFDTLRKKRIDSLQQQQAVSVENSDEAKREASLSRWKLEQARELAKVRELELQRAQEQLRQKSIRAPFDGYVLDTFKDSGEYVEDQPILRLAQLDPLLVEAIVPMAYFGEVKVGTPAEVVPEVLSGKKLRATVIVIDRIGDTASNTFGVRLELANPENRIPAGLKCVLKFLKPVKETARSLLPVNADQHIISPKTGNYQPLIDNSEKEILKDNTATENSRATDEVADSKKTPGYFVLMPQRKTSQLTRSLIDKLGQVGVSDLIQMHSGPYQGQIMLGFYSTLKAAENRQKSLEKLGFPTKILERE